MQKTFKKLSQIALTILVSFILSLVLNSTFYMNLSFQNSKIETPLAKNKYEVFGFAPYWTINKLDNVDYSVLTTLAYFDVPVNSDGSFDETSNGYSTLLSGKAESVFSQAKSYGTKVVVTLTQMNNDDIKTLLDDEDAQEKSIKNIIKLVKDYGFDGVNMDYEYVGNPGKDYRDEYSKYISKINEKLNKMGNKQVTVSVYASSARDSKLYDISALSSASDEIFMMAYDFATKSSSNVIPTSPLYGYKQGKYWYDVSTAVEDFLKVMPAEKLVLGLPWYGYNYPVDQPGVKVERSKGYYYTYYYRGRRYTAFQNYSSNTQTLAAASSNPNEQTGWDDVGKVSWHAYQEDGVWRMIFLEDSKSLKLKYQFAKDHSLAGVGVWALGFDAGSTDMWKLLSSEFGTRLADSSTAQ